MVYATLTEYDVDLDTHVKMGEAVGDAPVKGLILHAGGTSGHGVHSLDIWDRKEDSEAFFRDRMMPALQQLGLTEGGPPLSFQEFELPYVVRG